MSHRPKQSRDNNDPSQAADQTIRAAAISESEELFAQDEFGESNLPSWLTDTPYWAISSALHLTLLLLIGGVVLLQEEAEEDIKKGASVSIIDYEPPYRPKAPRRPTPKPMVANERNNKPAVDVSLNMVDNPRPARPAETPKVDTSPQPIGLGPSATPGSLHHGIYSSRLEGKGASPSGTEDAVRAALEWLRRHQHPDGHWSSDDYFSQCKSKDNECKMHSHAGHKGAGLKGFDVGVTALALLAFTGYGHTHKDGDYPEYVEVVRRGMKWLKKQQHKSSDKRIDGIYGPYKLEGENSNEEVPEEWIYNHAIATMAMAEILLLSNDAVNLRRSVTKATQWCLNAQQEEGGWKYGYQASTGGDTSVTGWMILALKTSRVCASARLIKIDPKEFRKPFTWALELMHNNTQTRSGITGYESPGDSGSEISSLYPAPYPYSKSMSCMTAVSVLCRLFAGESRRSKDVKNGKRVLMEELPVWRPQRGKRLSKINMYYWYYGSYALFQLGGKDWDRWNKAMIKSLLPSKDESTGQRVAVNGCADGSWDPIGEWGIAGGRVYSTAICAMTLEVYYRFKRIRKTNTH